MKDRVEAPGRVQLHVTMPYKLEPREQHQIRKYLDRGYRVEQLQRISDREAIVTLRAATASENLSSG